MGRLGVDLIAGTGDRTGFVELLERTWQERQPITALDNAFHRRSFEALPAGGLEGRTRAMLKIEDGCVNFCSYCIIPYARGRVRSLPLEQCAHEAQALAEAGYQEIVLTGIEISSWGQELGDGLALIDVVEAICRAVPAHIRVRAGQPGAPDHHPGVLPPCGRPAQPVPPLPPVYAVRVRLGFGPHEPKVRFRTVL